jgi:hypothetical protein
MSQNSQNPKEDSPVSTPKTIIKSEFTEPQVSYNDYERKRVSSNKPITQTAKNGSQYMKQVLNYSYGDLKLNHKDKFYVETCPLVSEYGIKEQEGKTQQGVPNGNMSYSVNVRFNEQTPDQKKCVDVFNDIIIAAAAEVYPHRIAMKKPGFDNSSMKMITATGMKNPIYRGKPDELTGEVAPGRDPTMFFKLRFGPRSLFTLPDGTEVPWPKLINKQVKAIYCVHIEYIYANGGTITVQLKVKSAVVLDIQEANSSNQQIQTMTKYAADDDLMKKLRDQMRSLSSVELKAKPDDNPKQLNGGQNVAQNGGQNQQMFNNSQGNNNPNMGIPGNSVGYNQGYQQQPQQQNYQQPQQQNYQQPMQQNNNPAIPAVPPQYTQGPANPQASMQAMAQMQALANASQN